MLPKTIPTSAAPLHAWQHVAAQLAGHEVHDLNNPLAAIKLNLTSLLDVLPPDAVDALEITNELQQSALALEGMFANHITLAFLEDPLRPPQPLSRVALGDTVSSVVMKLQSAARDQRIELSVGVLSPGACIQGDAEMMSLLVENLARNGLQHAGAGGRAVLSVTCTDGQVVLTMRDTGTLFGPPERDFSREGQLALKQSSERRYSRALGLYVVGAIADAHGATITTGSDPAGDSWAAVAFQAP